MVKTRGKSPKSSKNMEKNVAMKSSSGVLTRSRTATTLRSLFYQLDDDGAAAQNQLVFATPSNCTGQIPNDAARKPISVAAAAAIRAIKVPWGAASNTPKLTAARRIIRKNDAHSPNRGKQPAKGFTGKNAPHENEVSQNSCPSSDSSRNSNPFTLKSCSSHEMGVVSPTASQFKLQMEKLASKIAGEHVEFQPRPSMVPSAPEFVDKLQPSAIIDASMVLSAPEFVDKVQPSAVIDASMVLSAPGFVDKVQPSAVIDASMVPTGPKFVDKVQPSAVIDASMNVPPGYQQKTSEIRAEKRIGIDRAHSFNLTEMAGMMNQSCSDDEEVESSIDPTLVDVEGYSVKKEVAPLLQQIFDKHKDIARDCTIKSRKNRLPFLEMIYYICEKLESTSLKHISHDDLEDMSSVVDCLQNVGFDVKWLSERLEDIFTLKDLLKNYIGLKEENTKKIEIKEREVVMLKQRLSTGKAELAKMKDEVNVVNHNASQQIKGLMLKGLPLWDKSLLHGLI